MNEPYPGNHSGQPTPESNQPPAQPSGPPSQYPGPPAQHSGPPAAPYEPTQQYPAQQYPAQQYPAQPYAAGQATPQYGASSYGPPEGYAQPSQGYPQDTGYGQPGPYGQPPYEQPGYGTAPYSYAPPPKSGLSTTKIVLIVLAVVIVIGGVVGGVLATRKSDSKLTAGPATPSLSSPSTGSPTTAPPSTPPPSSTAGGASSIFKLPKTAAGMTLSPNSGLGDIMSKSLPDSVAGETTTGLYTDPGDPGKILILIGTQTNVGNPDVAVAGAFAGMGQSPTIKLKAPKSYSAGSQGGAMECAGGSLSELGQDIPVGVCAVADKHGLILTIFTSRSASSAASATRKLRPSFEHS
jgi:hypothetical protein